MWPNTFNIFGAIVHSDMAQMFRSYILQLGHVRAVLRSSRIRGQQETSPVSSHRHRPGCALQDRQGMVMEKLGYYKPAVMNSKFMPRS